MAVVFETSRLIVQELEMDCLPFVTEMLGDAEVMKYWPRPYTAEEAKQWIERHQERYRQDGYGYWLMRLKETNEPVGQAGLLKQEIEGVSELGLGWIVHQPFWRKGYAFEAASGCVEYAFSKLGEERVIALIRPENEPSMALALKLSMRYEKTVEYFGFDHAVMALQTLSRAN